MRDKQKKKDSIIPIKCKHTNEYTGRNKRMTRKKNEIHSDALIFFLNMIFDRRKKRRRRKRISSHKIHHLSEQKKNSLKKKYLFYISFKPGRLRL